MTSSIKPTTLISLNLPSHLKDILDQYSRSTNISKTYLIRYLLEQHLSRYQGMGQHEQRRIDMKIVTETAATEGLESLLGQNVTLFCI